MFKKLIAVLCISLATGGTALAQEEGGSAAAASTAVDSREGADAGKQVPEQVGCDHWAYRDIAALAQKYAPEQKLPECKPCSRADLAHCLLDVMEKIVQTSQKEGNKSLQREDLLKLAALQSALEPELTKQESYRTTRGTIQEIATSAEPDHLEYLYQFGINGFFRQEGAKNYRLPDLSFQPRRDEGRLLYRVKPYAYWHPTDYLDFHLEGQAYGYHGRSRHDEASLYQGFVDARIPGEKWLGLKAGRQEFVYGSAFVLGADSSFDGLSFDAVRLRLQPTEKTTLDFLGGRYADEFSAGVEGNLVGAYFNYAAAEDSALEAYLLRDAGSAEHHPGEYLDIMGLRGTGKFGPLSLELEPVYQSGKRFNPLSGANGNIDAYGGHADLTGDFQPFGFKSKVVLGYAIGSGDQNPVGNKEFRNHINDTSLVGDMHLVGDLSGIDVGGHHASGLQIYTLGWGVDLSEQLNFSATAHKFVARYVEDGFSRHLGTEGDFILTYTINKDFSVVVAYDHFFAEQFFRQASGSDRDVSYAYAMLTFNFDKKKAKGVKP